MKRPYESGSSSRAKTRAPLGNENLVDVFSNLDRNTLDTMLITCLRHGHVVNEHMEEVCLRLVNCTIRERSRGGSTQYELSFTQSLSSLQIPDRTFSSIEEVFVHFKFAMRHGLLEDLELIDVRLSVDFVSRFEVAVHGARLLGTYRVHNCVRGTDGWALSMIEPFSEINQIDGVFFTEMADDDGIVAAYCSKRVGGLASCPFGVSSTAVALQLAFGCDAASSTHGYRHLLVEVSKFEKDFFAHLLKIHSDLGSDWATPLDAKLQGWLTMAGWEEVDMAPLAEYKVPSTQPRTSTASSSSAYRIFANGMRMDVHVKATDCSVFVNIKRGRDGVFWAPGRPWDA